MTPNVALLKQTLAHIEANPQDWHQNLYRSGVCFGGTAVELDGGTWLIGDISEYSDLAPELAALVPTPKEIADGDIRFYDDKHGNFMEGVYAGDRAQRILGLTDGQRALLFDPFNTLPDLRRIVAELCEEAS